MNPSILQQSTIVNTLWMFALIFIIFYFFMIRPQIKKQKDDKEFHQSLKKGKYVVTNSGIHGKISEVTNDYCIIESILGQIKIEKNTISKDLTKLRYEHSNHNSLEKKQKINKK
ncbi:preprotein translocase subunit YajC [Blattabacterium cuenoti]|uniref:preprotein translocase subunit YajC n=1 Tax=Blattabacterium cuenoti TaxID=1653831 RepID=UPI00163B6A20|nr:preprotein translocase subunit YajC [Blattabacterium cuenoti]